MGGVFKQRIFHMSILTREKFDILDARSLTLPNIQTFREKSFHAENDAEKHFHC